MSVHCDIMSVHCDIVISQLVTLPPPPAKLVLLCMASQGVWVVPCSVNR